jgi:peptide/nickel transport system ATP-binding protein
MGGEWRASNMVHKEDSNAAAHIAEPDVLLRAVGLSKSYVQGGVLARGRTRIAALCDINLKIRTGTTLALIGSSGTGKSTLARCLACLECPDSGEIWLGAANLTKLPPRELIPIRRKIQLIFQDPASSLNPRLTAAEIIGEPLLVSGATIKSQRHTRARELMELVGLPAAWENHRPFELSGGQRQRLAIARALSIEPKLLILDEALTGLDLSIQAQIANLLLDLQSSRGLTYLYISHDLNLVSHLADEVAVLDCGKIIESATCGELFSSPRSLQARGLVEATLALREN